MWRNFRLAGNRRIVGDIIAASSIPSHWKRIIHPKKEVLKSGQGASSGNRHGFGAIASGDGERRKCFRGCKCPRMCVLVFWQTAQRLVSIFNSKHKHQYGCQVIVEPHSWIEYLRLWMYVRNVRQVFAFGLYRIYSIYLSIIHQPHIYVPNRTSTTYSTPNRIHETPHTRCVRTRHVWMDGDIYRYMILVSCSIQWRASALLPYFRSLSTRASVVFVCDWVCFVLCGCFFTGEVWEWDDDKLAALHPRCLSILCCTLLAINNPLILPNSIDDWFRSCSLFVLPTEKRHKPNQESLLVCLLWIRFAV